MLNYNWQGLDVAELRKFVSMSESSGGLHNDGRELSAPRDPPLVMSISDLDAQAQSHESVGAGTFFHDIRGENFTEIHIS